MQWVKHPMPLNPPVLAFGQSVFHGVPTRPDETVTELVNVLACYLTPGQLEAALEQWEAAVEKLRSASMCRSMRSSSGPLMRALYLIICDGEQRHSCLGSPRYPHGQRFVAFPPPDHYHRSPQETGVSEDPCDHRRPYQEAAARFGSVPTTSRRPNWGGRSLDLELGKGWGKAGNPTPTGHHQVPRLQPVTGADGPPCPARLGSLQPRFGSGSISSIDWR